MEKRFVGRKKRRNVKEKGTEMKREKKKKKKMKTCETYENLNIENCLNKG